MPFNRPKAKIHFKSDSNHLLIDFFNPIPAVRFNRRDASIQIRTQISNSNYIENWLNLIANGRKRPAFVIFVVIFNIICRFRLNT